MSSHPLTWRGLRAKAHVREAQQPQLASRRALAESDVCLRKGACLSHDTAGVAGDGCRDFISPVRTGK